MPAKWQHCWPPSCKETPAGERCFPNAQQIHHQSRWRHPAKASSSYWGPKGWVSQSSVSFRVLVIVVVLGQSDVMFLFRNSLQFSGTNSWFSGLSPTVLCIYLPESSSTLRCVNFRHLPPLQCNSTVQKKIICVLTVQISFGLGNHLKRVAPPLAPGSGTSTSLMHWGCYASVAANICRAVGESFPTENPATNCLVAFWSVNLKAIRLRSNFA